MFVVMFSVLEWNMPIVQDANVRVACNRCKSNAALMAAQSGQEAVGHGLYGAPMCKVKITERPINNS